MILRIGSFKQLVFSGLLILFNGSILMGQKIKIEPPNWWTGMHNQELELLLHGAGVGLAEATINTPGVLLKGALAGQSSNYLFLKLQVSEDAQAGEFLIKLEFPDKSELSIPYLLLNREITPKQLKGFDSSDVIYLITPDRFANGNPKNDVVSGMREDSLNRKDTYARHGGDIQGIIQHLDYIAQMGFTAIWPSPLLENDMPEQSYHGYAITDYYRVDPRFGSLSDYKALADACKEKGIKLIMDQVANHCGLHHWWMRDLPFDDWINFQEEYLKGETVLCNHIRTANQDIYVSQADAVAMSDGWFVPSMPDLNQRNEQLANYLIQNSIWWIESLGLQGIRQDTYPYPDKTFMSRWAQAIMTEYPHFSIVGEEWSTNPLLVGYWQQGARNADGYQSHLTSTMDFPLQEKLVDALIQEEGWNQGFMLLYEALANDFHYPDPMNVLAFGDNHDMDRLFTQLGEDVELTKMALAYLLCIPRIPQIYYGTEIGMNNTAKPGDHGLIRTDFPGGWAKDRRNAFTGKGLKKWELDLQEYCRRLLNFRKNNPVLHWGKTKHFAPQDGVYVLSRFSEEGEVVLILNKNKNEVALDLSRFEELNLSGTIMESPLNGRQYLWDTTLKIPTGVLILESKR